MYVVVYACSVLLLFVCMASDNVCLTIMILIDDYELYQPQSCLFVRRGRFSTLLVTAHLWD